LETAIDNGVNFIDTAACYAKGRCGFYLNIFFPELFYTFTNLKQQK